MDLKGYIFFLGYILVNSVIFTQVGGILNIWGTLSPYITSYYHSLDPSITSSYLVQIALISYISEGLFVLLVPFCAKKIPIIVVMIASISFSSLSLFLTSYISNPTLFCWCFGGLLGYLSAFTFIPAVWIAIDAIPQHKGAVMGIGLCAYSMAPTIYGFVFTLMVNPSNEYPVGEPKYFENEVSSNVPLSLIYLALIILVLGVVGSILMAKNKNISFESTSSQTYTFAQVITHGKFWYLFMYLFTKSAMYYYLINVYKDIAFLFMDDDYFIAGIGAVAFISAGLGRLVIGKLMDVIPWKVLILAMTALELGITIALYYSAVYKYLYAVLVVVCLFISPCSFLIAWMQTEKAYPKDKWVFSLINLATLLDLAAVFLLESFISYSFGYQWSLFIVASELIISMILVLCCFDKYISVKPDPLLEKSCKA